MAIFDRFKRNNNQDSVMPAEVQDYYKAERRDKAGMAWLLAVITLIATIMIAAGLFFGGRFIYRAITGNDDTSQTQTQTESESEDAANSEGESTPAANDGGQTSSTNTSTPATPPTTPAPPTTTPAPSTSPVTGPSELVNTGPGDE